MKKTYFRTSAHLIWKMGLPFLCSGLLMTACGGDDEDDNPTNGGGNSTSSTTMRPGVFVVDGTEYRITKVGHDSFSYGLDGTLTAIHTVVTDYTIASSPFVLNSEIDSDTQKWYDFSFNSRGYITKMSVSCAYSSNSDLIDGSYSLSYNSNNQLSKIAFSAIRTSVKGNISHKYSYEDTYTLTYNGENLVKVAIVCSTTEDGVVSTTIYDNVITPGNIENPSRQCGFIMCNAISPTIGTCLLDHDIFAELGLMGQGSKMLPSQIQYNIVKSDGTKISEDNTYSYKLTNQLISEESYNNYSISYSYTH
jgi:hypothetical protein